VAEELWLRNGGWKTCLLQINMRMAPDTTDLSDRAYVWKTLDSAVASDPFQKLAYMISTGNLVRLWCCCALGLCTCVSVLITLGASPRRFSSPRPCCDMMRHTQPDPAPLTPAASPPPASAPSTKSMTGVLRRADAIRVDAVVCGQVSQSGLDLSQVSGFSVVADKLNFLRYVSHFRSVHRGAFFTTLRTTTVRKLLPESWGFLCPVHTPDGSPCGLLNHLARACSTVTEQPDDPAPRNATILRCDSTPLCFAFPAERVAVHSTRQMLPQSLRVSPSEHRPRLFRQAHGHFTHSLTHAHTHTRTRTLSLTHLTIGEQPWQNRQASLPPSWFLQPLTLPPPRTY
jgi:hypothetical protein